MTSMFAHFNFEFLIQLFSAGYGSEVVGQSSVGQQIWLTEISIVERSLGTQSMKLFPFGIFLILCASMMLVSFVELAAC